MPLIVLKTKPFTLGKRLFLYGLYVHNHEEILKEPFKIEIGVIKK